MIFIGTLNDYLFQYVETEQTVEGATGCEDDNFLLAPVTACTSGMPGLSEALKVNK